MVPGSRLGTGLQLMQFNNPTGTKTKTKNMTTLHLKKSSIRSPLRLGFLLTPLALACFALSPTARAQLPPPAPDGGYPGNNTAEGDGALSSVQINPTTGFGIDNTAIGFDALFSNTTGGANTATGFAALQQNTTGTDNTANGFSALSGNTTGSNNTANGVEALLDNTKGSNNTATGIVALAFNTTGNANTATGFAALQQNTTGGANTATGGGALSSNTTGLFNTATGVSTLVNNTSGNVNTATGASALQSNTTGFDNTAEGVNALLNSTTGSNNIALGANAGSRLTTGSNNIDIGALGVAGESNTIRIGRVGLQKAAYMQGISGATVARGVTVIVDTTGHLGTVVSSERFKEAIKPMDKASEAILALKPVAFRYKHELDPEGIPQFGLVAEQVEKVNPDLVARDSEGKVYSVRYEAVNAMLLNEFLKEHRKVEQLESKAQKQEAMIAQQQKGMEILNASLKEQAAQIQKVSDQLELTKSTPRIVADNQ
jgi:Chaperone of endosialidase